MHKFKRGVILLLAFLLAVTPMATAFATTKITYFQESEWNLALLQFLVDEYGAELGVELYQWLQEVRLIDENGQFIQHLIYLNGTGYTLDQMKEMLADENIDLSQMAEIDGQLIPLEAIKKMIEIEDQLSLLAQRINGVEITSEHLHSMISLIQQASTEGLPMLEAESDDSFDPLEEAQSLGVSEQTQNPYKDEVIVRLYTVNVESDSMNTLSY